MSYIKFEEGPSSKSGLTKTWYIIGSAEHKIGKIYWYAAWRKYVFDAWNAVFDWECLREIADFIEKETEAQRTVWRKRKEENNVYRSN